MDRQHIIGGARPPDHLSSAISQILRAKSRRSNDKVLVVGERIEASKSEVYRLDIRMLAYIIPGLNDGDGNIRMRRETIRDDETT